MEAINADELGTLLTLGAAALGSLLVIVVNCIHGSKCSRIKCCGFQCDRVVTPPVREAVPEPVREAVPEPEPEPEPEPATLTQLNIKPPQLNIKPASSSVC
jgi:hypothetical protein